jgi:acyl-CoA hydrolase
VDVFLRAAQQNEVVEIGVATVSVGRTSITVRCEVREKDSQELILAIDKIVFVALNSRGKPIVHKLARREAKPVRREAKSAEPVWARARWPRWLAPGADEASKDAA